MKDYKAPRPIPQQAYEYDVLGNLIKVTDAKNKYKGVTSQQI